MKIKVGLFGFGRTGSLVAKEIVNDSELSLEWVCRRRVPENLIYASHALGYDANFAQFVSFKDMTSSFLKSHPVDVMIDFSSPAASSGYQLLVDNNIKIVTAISKYSPEELAHIKALSSKVAILCSPNITLGINWLMMASKILKNIIPHADIEIVEEHFRDKSETSGTALRLADQLELSPDEHVNSIRVGGVVGKHEVIFGLPYQTIRITHESISRAAFGTGAVFALKWLKDKKSGLYSMEQVFKEKFIKKINELDL